MFDVHCLITMHERNTVLAARSSWWLIVFVNARWYSASSTLGDSFTPFVEVVVMKDGRRHAQLVDMK